MRLGRGLRVEEVGTAVSKTAGRLPPQSGKAVARIGLRMMPTSPPPPLSFRTSGFPQYGWKAGLSDGAFPDRCPVKPAPGMPEPTAGLRPSFVRLVVTKNSRSVSGR